MTYVIFLLLYLSCSLYIVNSLHINAISFNYINENDNLLPLLDDFLEYSENEGLNITVSLNTISFSNNKSFLRDYGTMLDYLFRKKSDKYDLFFFDAIYTYRFSSYLENLETWLPEEHLQMYDSGIAPIYCLNTLNQYISLPLYIDYSILYSNEELLNKYGKEIPKTWEELFEISKFIKNEESSNNDLLIYNGLFPSDEAGMCSIYEYLYSYRESLEETIPEIQSDTTKTALEKLKQFEIDLDLASSFSSDERDTLYRLKDGKALFLKYWKLRDDNIHSVYKKSILPGSHEGISGSCIAGINVGINQCISDENKKAASQIIEYITSKRAQRKYVIKGYFTSAIPSLYSDHVVCSEYPCELINNVQFISRPINITDDYDDYSDKYQYYIYEYLFGNMSVSDALTKIENLSRIFYLSMDGKDTGVGAIIIVFQTLLCIIMTLSLVILRFDEHQSYFRFLPSKFWVVTVLGSNFIIAAGFTEIGQVTLIKCHLKPLFLFVGYALNYIPILFRLIINFPEENKISKWIKSHRYIYLFTFLIFYAILSSFTLLTPFEIRVGGVEGGQKFEQCVKSGLWVTVHQISLLGINFLMILSILGFIFVEWNIESIYYDLRFIISAIYADVLSIILLFIVSSIDVPNFILYEVVRQFAFIILAVSNYMFLFGYRIFWALLKSEDDTEDDTINRLVNLLMKNNDLERSDNNHNNSRNFLNSGNRSMKNLNNVSQKLLTYHFRTSINSEASQQPNQSNNENDDPQLNLVPSVTTSPSFTLLSQTLNTPSYKSPYIDNISPSYKSPFIENMSPSYKKAFLNKSSSFL